MNEFERLEDLTYLEVAALKPIKIDGLYWEDYDDTLVDGRYRATRTTPERKAPTSLYFSSDLRLFFDNPKEEGGRAWFSNYSGLHPVFKANGERLVINSLRNVSARYDGKEISKYYRP